MKYFLIDEISDSDLKKIEDFLKSNAVSSGLEKVFWIEISDHCLSKEQADQVNHKPYVFSVECGKDWIKAELFIRSLGNFQGEYQGYCTSVQKDFIAEYIESMIQELDIKT